MTSQEKRINVCARIVAADDTIKADLLDQTPLIKDSLVALLDRMSAPTDKNGLAWKIEITSLCRDHGDDSQLGPHGHRRGFSVDMWPVNNNLQQFVHDLIWNCPPCTKVGLGGSEAQALFPQCANGATYVVNGTAVFWDNDEPHIHAQSA